MRLPPSSRTGFAPKTAPATAASALPAGRAVATTASPAKACKPSQGLESVNGLTVMLSINPQLMIRVSPALPSWDEAYCTWHLYSLRPEKGVPVDAMMMMMRCLPVQPTMMKEWMANVLSVMTRASRDCANPSCPRSWILFRWRAWLGQRRWPELLGVGRPTRRLAR